MIIQENDLKLIEEYNGTVCELWIDPFYIKICESYFHLLEGTEWDVFEISDTLYIKSILERNRSTKEAKLISYLNNPIEYIQGVLKRVCEAVPLYKSFHDTGISGKEIGWDKSGKLRMIKEKELKTKSAVDSKIIILNITRNV